MALFSLQCIYWPNDGRSHDRTAGFSLGQRGKETFEFQSSTTLILDIHNTLNNGQQTGRNIDIRAYWNKQTVSRSTWHSIQ